MKMEGLYLGIELSDRGCNIAARDPQTKVIHPMELENQETWIPGYLCYDMEADAWVTGHEARQCQGKSNCVILYRLVSLFLSGQSLNINERVYHADWLFQTYLQQMIQRAKAYFESTEVLELVVCINGIHVLEGERLLRLFLNLGFSGKHVHIMNKQECYSHYVMSKEKEAWSNACFLLDYSEEGLGFYDLSVLKKMQPPIVHTIYEKIEDAPDISSLFGEEEQRRMVDQWFSEFISEKSDRRILNGVFLTGEGFANPGWCNQFSRSVLGQKSRKLAQVNSIYSMGAACAAYHLFDSENRFPHVCICSDRISVTVSLMVDSAEGKKQLILATPGMNYREVRTHLDLMLEDQKELVLMIRDVGAQEVHKQVIDLNPFMSFAQDRIRIRFSMAFTSESELMVNVEDCGFGDFYPASGQIIHKEYEV